MKCRLCLKENVKLCKSHIIAKFEYENNGLIKGGTGAMFDFNTGRILKSRIGEYEELLCQDCEKMLNVSFEDYAKKMLWGGLGKESPMFRVLNDPINGLLYQFSGVDTERYKSYLLLNLWRASVSSRPFFERLRLPENIEELLREKLLKQKPITNSEAIISIHSFESSKNLHPIIVPPMYADGIALFVIGKVFYMYYLEKEVVPEGVESFSPNNGEFIIQIVEETRTKRILNNFFGGDIL